MKRRYQLIYPEYLGLHRDSKVILEENGQFYIAKMGKGELKLEKWFVERKKSEAVFLELCSKTF